MVLQVCIRTLVFSLLHASLLSSLFSFSCTSPRVLVRVLVCLAPSLHISLLESCSESGEYRRDDPNVDVPALVSDMFAQKVAVEQRRCGETRVNVCRYNSSRRWASVKTRPR